MELSDVEDVLKDPEKIRRRYLETRNKELKLLDDLESVYKVWIKVGQGEAQFSKFTEEVLVFREHLKEKYELWQGFKKGEKPGLNEGGNGEIFMRWVGLGIMEEEPGLLRDGSEGIGTEVAPNDENDKASLELRFKVADEDNSYCVFRFNTSLKEVKDRLRTTYQEMDAMRKASDPLKI
ncbi:MAG: hypothetical protein HYV90_01585 [Candidatus Woesebacteria bacterium]|nr:MAG: hypothetical protein HYV90_01585 [Candidatus Woesebacteria bacterium]